VFTDVWIRTTSGFSCYLFFADVEDSSGVSYSLVRAGVEDSSGSNGMCRRWRFSCYLVFFSDDEDSSGSNGMCRRWRFSGFLTLASTVYHVVGRQALTVALMRLTSRLDRWKSQHRQRYSGPYCISCSGRLSLKPRSGDDGSSLLISGLCFIQSFQRSVNRAHNYRNISPMAYLSVGL
jgi:hypothetical protein